jgi:outer membrane protein assembly factor BamB
MTRTAARGAPLAVLVGVGAVAAAARLTRPASRHAITAAPTGPSSSSTASTAPSSSPSSAFTLGAPLPDDGGRALPDGGSPAHGARFLHGDTHRTNRAHGHGPRVAKLAWVFDADGAIEAQVTASLDEQTLYVATLAGTLLALTRDGKRRWSVPLGGRAYAAPCVGQDGTIYVGSDAQRLFAVSPEGQIKWKLETEGEADTGALLAADGTVVFAAGSSVLAVRPGGDLAWRFAAKAKIFTAPAQTDEGTLVVGSQDHRVYGIKPTGLVAWSVDLGSDVDGAPAIDDHDGIFVGNDGGEIVRLDARGTVVWRRSVGGFVRGPLSVARNGDVLAGVYGPTPRLVRLTPDGVIRGAFAVPGTGAREFGVHGGPLEDDDGSLYFGAQDDTLYAVAASGETLWRYALGDDVDAPTTLLSDGTLLAAADDGKVYAFQP